MSNSIDLATCMTNFSLPIHSSCLMSPSTHPSIHLSISLPLSLSMTHKHIQNVVALHCFSYIANKIMQQSPLASTKLSPSSVLVSSAVCDTSPSLDMYSGLSRSTLTSSYNGHFILAHPLLLLLTSAFLQMSQVFFRLTLLSILCVAVLRQFLCLFSANICF